MKQIIENRIKELKEYVSFNKWEMAAKEDKIELLQSILDEANENKAAEETVYKVGDRLIIRGHEQIIARVDADEIVLIDLFDGNRWREPINVADDTNISYKELKGYIGDDEFELK